MSPTDDFDPEDAIVPIDSTYSVVDPVFFLVGILRREWDSHRTDGVVPTIDFSEVQKNLIFSPGPNSDYVTVYTTDVTPKLLSISYGFVSSDHDFMVELTTSGDRTHAIRFNEEVRRILRNHRKDTLGRIDPKVSGRQWAEFPTKESPMEKISKNMYRRTMDGVYHQVFQRIHSNSPDG